MDRTSQPPDEGDHFEAVLREHHKLARQFDVGLKDLADYFQENLADVTRHLLSAVPKQMEAWRQEALRKYGYDPEHRESASSLEGFVKSAEDAKGLVALLNHYYTYSLVIEQWKCYVQSGLSGERLQMAVCQSVIEAYRQRPGLAAKGIEALEAGMPGFPQGLALSVYLTTHVAVHTSLHKNRRLWAAIEELRTGDESTFSRLLKELPAEALAAYREREAGWGDLMDVRTEAARRLAKLGKTDAPSELQELAEFANREILLKRAKAARLSPQELDLFQLCIDKPKLTYREIAAELGVSVSQVGVIKHRIKNKLCA
jgi:DNA-binding CsgD family transcriptional regulator